jgi:flagellar biosynthetic protein FlhB
MTAHVHLAHSALLLARISIEMMLKVLAFLIIVSIADYFFQRRQYIQQLKMTKQEMKEEMKETEGDPYVKSRIRERMQQLAFRNMYRSVPEADVVITNPTHFAVALAYEMGAMDAPRVTAKGVDATAQKIKEIAKDNGVELVENIELARALYYSVDIGDEIPEALYAAVSTIFSHIFRMRAQQSRMQNVG